MFIKSCFGLFNTDNIERFTVSGEATYAFGVGSSVPKPISCFDVIDEIATALKNGDNFLEVK